MGQLAELQLPRVAVLTEQIGPGEIESFVTAAALVIAVRGPGGPAEKLGQGRARGGQVGEPVAAIGDRSDRRGRIHTIDAVRPEQSALGIDQPPLSLAFLGTEPPGGRQLRTGLPATILIPAGRTGMGRQLGFFLLAMLPQLFQGVGLAGPVLVDVLAEGVDQGEEGLVRRFHFLGRAGGAEPGDLEDVLRLGLGQEDDHLVDQRRIDARFLAIAFGIASHAEQRLARQRHRQGLALARVQRDAAGHAVLHAVGVRVVNPQIHVDAALAHVLHVQQHFGKGREVPASLGRADRDSRPGLAVPGRHPQPMLGGAGVGVVGLDLGRDPVLVELQECLVGQGRRDGRRDDHQQRHKVACQHGANLPCES